MTFVEDTSHMFCFGCIYLFRSVAITQIQLLYKKVLQSGRICSEINEDVISMSKLHNTTRRM